MPKDMYPVLMRIMDDQNRLTDRADTKAISLLSTLGLFTILFMSQFNNFKVEPFSLFLLVVYLLSIILAVFHIVMAISPRIRGTKDKQNKNTSKIVPPQPTFFSGISQFQSSEAYKKCLDDFVNNEDTVNETYARQVYEVAKINNTKYKYVGRSVWFVVIAISSQITFIVFSFANKI
jgi:hypothetical protein